MSWGHFPSDWVRYNNGLDQFPVGMGKTGATIAALKLFLAIAANVDYETRSVQMSYTDIEEICGLSRPMIRPAITRLVELDLVEVDSATHIQVYTLKPNRYGSSSHARIAQDTVMNDLRRFSNTDPKSARALKHLILMLAHASKTSSGRTVKLTHEKFVEHCSTPPRLISTINTMLASAGFIRTQRAEPTDSQTYSANEYVMTGDYAGSARKIHMPSQNQRRLRKGRVQRVRS